MYTIFGLNLFILSQDIEQKSNSDINPGLQPCCKFAKTMIYITNIDLVNDNVYTKFGLSLSIRFEDIEQKLNSDVNQGP